MPSSPAQLRLAPQLEVRFPMPVDTQSRRGWIEERRISAAFETALEIEGRAAWLARQIETNAATARDTRNQVVGMNSELSRFGSNLPDDLRNRLIKALGHAQDAAMIDDLPSVKRLMQQVRTMVEDCRKVAFA